MLTNADKRRLTPEDLLMEERALLKIQRDREEDEADYNFHCASQDAVEANPNATSVKGRRLTNRSDAQRRNEAAAKDGPSIMDYFMSPAATLQGFKQFCVDAKHLVDFFSNAQVAKIDDPRIHLTETHAFDVEYVTPETQAALDREAGIINTRLKSLYTIREASSRMVEMEKIVQLAADYDMLMHPRLNLYVHSLERVAQMESINNPRKIVQHSAVCVFRPLANAPGERGIKMLVGDVLDNNPSEVIASGQHLAPELKQG